MKHPFLRPKYVYRNASLVNLLGLGPPDAFRASQRLLEEIGRTIGPQFGVDVVRVVNIDFSALRHLEPDSEGLDLVMERLVEKQDRKCSADRAKDRVALPPPSRRKVGEDGAGKVHDRGLLY